LNWERGGCFKNGFNSKSDKRCHLDPSDPSEVSLLKRKKGKNRKMEGRSEKEREREKEEGVSFYFVSDMRSDGEVGEVEREGKRKKERGI